MQMFLLVALATMLHSCVYEDEVPCPCELRFVYDYNMEFADAFPTQVDDVILFIFDEQGRFVQQREEQGEAFDTDYRMQLSLPAGTYRLVAWAGTRTDADCYRLSPALTPGVSTIDELKLRLNATETTYARNLADLWHGMLPTFKVEPNAPAYGVLPLVKDVNRFRILLQYTGGEALSGSDYAVYLRADNHRYNYDNSLEASGVLNYMPYVQQTAQLVNDSEDLVSPSVGNISAVVAELATLRLMADQATRFVVRDLKKGKDLLNINLVQYLELMRMEEHADMPLQEYLDRESTYRIILFMEKNSAGALTMVAMQINRWRLVLNVNDL